MKIQTNAGEVELTAEMVCRGMVFAPKDPSDYCLAEGRIFVVGRRDDANGVWRDARDENLGTNVIGAGADGLLGCDPTVASRAACERFGVHGDAAAHGFARLRGGGAVDLRKTGSLPVGSVIDLYGSGGRMAVDGGGLCGGAEGFAGLNARHASPEDVRRLCCGAEETTTVTVRGFAGVSPTGRVCTLAIGDHDTHEDLATGVKWAAKSREDFNANLRAAAALAKPREGTAEDIQRRVAESFAASAVVGWKVAQESATKFAQALGACPNCGGDDATCRGSLAGLKACAAKRARTGRAPAAIGWRNGSASLGQSQAHVLRDGDVYRWQVNHLGLRIRDGVEPHTFDAHAAAGRILFAVHDATPAAMRAKQEAPLVALVAAVPEGLDPIGWRAAVLAVHECATSKKWDVHDLFYVHAISWALSARFAYGTIPDAGESSQVVTLAVAAYQRAITQAPKVDRVRATWKTRGPVLPCDNGEDE